MALLTEAVFLLSFASAIAVNFSVVYEWERFDFNRQPEAMTKDSYPVYMAVFGERVFLSLYPPRTVPATLVWLPTSSASPAKLTPLADKETHKKDDCKKIQHSTGLEVDARGRLWALDNGNDKCRAKLWIFDVANGDELKLVHQFPDTVVPSNTKQRWLHDLVLEETEDDWLAYILDMKSGLLSAFSLRLNQSRSLASVGERFQALALSPKTEQGRHLFLTKNEVNSTALFRVPVSEISAETGGRNANLGVVGSWTGKPYRMLADSTGLVHAAFLDRKYVVIGSVTNIFFHEHRLFEVDELRNNWPFTFALDPSGTLWLMATSKRRFSLLRASVGVRPYLYDNPRGTILSVFKGYFKIACFVFLCVVLLAFSATVILAAKARNKTPAEPCHQSTTEIFSIAEGANCHDNPAMLNNYPDSLPCNYATLQPPSQKRFGTFRPASLESRSDTTPSAPEECADYDDVGVAKLPCGDFDTGPPTAVHYVDLRPESVCYLEILPNVD